MTLPGADTINAGAIGDEGFLPIVFLGFEMPLGAGIVVVGSVVVVVEDEGEEENALVELSGLLSSAGPSLAIGIWNFTVTPFSLSLNNLLDSV